MSRTTPTSLPCLLVPHSNATYFFCHVSSNGSSPVQQTTSSSSASFISTFMFCRCHVPYSLSPLFCSQTFLIFATKRGIDSPCASASMSLCSRVLIIVLYPFLRLSPSLLCFALFILP